MVRCFFCGKEIADLDEPICSGCAAMDTGDLLKKHGLSGGDLDELEVDDGTEDGMLAFIADAKESANKKPQESNVSPRGVS